MQFVEKYVMISVLLWDYFILRIVMLYWDVQDARKFQITAETYPGLTFKVFWSLK